MNRRSFLKGLTYIPAAFALHSVPVVGLDNLATHRAPDSIVSGITLSDTKLIFDRFRMAYMYRGVARMDGCDSSVKYFSVFVDEKDGLSNEGFRDELYRVIRNAFA